MHHSFSMRQLTQQIEAGSGQAEEKHVQIIGRMQACQPDRQCAQKGRLAGSGIAENDDMSIPAVDVLFFACVGIGVQVNPQGVLRAFIHIVDDANRHTANRNLAPGMVSAGRFGPLLSVPAVNSRICRRAFAV